MSADRVTEVYADGIGKCRFSGGVVRIDLLSASEALDGQDETAPAEVVQRVILSPQGFIRAVHHLNNLTRELMKAGVIPSETNDKESAGSK